MGFTLPVKGIQDLKIGKKLTIELHGEEITFDEHGFPIHAPPPEPSEEYVNKIKERNKHLRE